ncbi:mating-type P-specific polypeptide Pc [Schizosaccharomyces cryophilus OY26]|uniref:Mating-type P-specific polypeptide Pc n=1 Tax=Schizosaccharomyces cryophilus (strain OY26 / ATCC MYA-4695 / CBS 11777 / NBRC 106824 / NRRL Y48691) TaxID=653667 RepID=S9VTU7_SCHCR|nr:mating-type P-specific polypeptide Pc [Schizosaccharomyces cryophilus OY26]EPY49594.1 mating-type P-specific polypeptide Pc [Schizosaccharomyces cryophilus OY26]
MNPTLKKPKKNRNSNHNYKNGFILFRSRIHKLLKSSGDWGGVSAKCSNIWRSLPQNVKSAWSQTAELSQYQDVRKQIATLEKIILTLWHKEHNNYKLHISTVQ